MHSMTVKGLKALIMGLLCLGFIAHTFPARAAEDPAEVKRQQAEVERLQQELKQAEQELERLRQENRRLKEQPPAAPAAPEEPPRTDFAALPELSPGSIVRADDLARHFAADRQAAATRYSGQVLVVEGVIAGFDTGLMTRRYDLRLETPGRSPFVICRFNYVQTHRSVDLADQGTRLIGRIDTRRFQTLYRLDETVRIRGRCKGVDGGTVLLVDCERSQ